MNCGAHCIVLVQCQMYVRSMLQTKMLNNKILPVLLLMQFNAASLCTTGCINFVADLKKISSIYCTYGAWYMWVASTWSGVHLLITYDTHVYYPPSQTYSNLLWEMYIPAYKLISLHCQLLVSLVFVSCTYIVPSPPAQLVEVPVDRMVNEASSIEGQPLTSGDWCWWARLTSRSPGHYHNC